MINKFVILVSFVLLLTGCDSVLINKSLTCNEIIIVKIHQFNAETRTGVMLFEGEQMEHGQLRLRNHLPSLPAVTTTLTNGRYFHALPRDSKLIQANVGENLTPVCWFEDYRFQNSRFYIRVVDE